MADTHSIYIKVDSTETNKAATNLNNMEKATNGAEKALSSLTRAAVGLVALDKIGGLAKGIIETNMAMESLRAQLVSVTGSAIGAQKAFKFIQDFATSTPYEIDGLTKSYITLQNYGIKPTKQVMEAITNQASKLGASQETLDGIVRALGQAYSVGKLRAEEMLQLSERGVPVFDLLSQVTGKNAAQLQEMASKGQLTRDVIEQLISKMGELASGANANAMETLSGKISNLSDAWHQFEDALLNDKSEGIIKSIVDGISATLNKLTAEMSKSPLAQIEEQLASAQKSLAQYNQMDKMMVGQKIKDKEREIAKLSELKNAVTQTNAEQMQQEDARVAKQEEARKKLLDGDGKIVTSKKQQTAATKALNDAESAFNATIQANISSVQNQGTIQDAQIKTAEKRLQAELAAAKAQAQTAMDATSSDEERMKIQEDLAAKSEEIIVKETELRQQQITIDEQVLSARISGLEQELSASDKFNASQSERIRLETQIQALKAQQQVIPEARAQIEIQATQDLQAAYADLNDLKLKSIDTEKAVRDEALRTLEVMSSNLEYAQSMAKGLAEAFGAVGQSIGDVAVAMANYEKQMATIEVQKNEQLEKAKGDPKKRQQAEETAALKVAQTQIKAYGDMAQAAQGFFKKGTAGYNALGAAVKVFRAFEVAQSVMSTVKQMEQMGGMLTFFTDALTQMGLISAAETTKSVTESATKAEAKAVEGAAQQGTEGDPYTAFARVAAWIALMAGLGIAISGGGGGSSASAPPAKAGTGTVLGDPNAQSQSLGNSLEQLVNINSNDLAYSAGMLESLRKIESSLADASALIAKQVMPLVAGVMSKFSAAGMMSSSKVTEAGFIVNAKDLQKVLSSGTLGGMMGFRAESTTGMMGEFHSATQQVTAYGKKISEAFGKIVVSVYDAIVEGGKAIGVSADVISQRAKDYVVSVGKINIAGMSSEEAAKEIEAAFSSMSDSMAMKLLPEFKDFRKSGEGYFETMVRVGSGVADATKKLELLGFKAIDYSQIEKKKGDVAAEVARQTLMAQTDLGDGAKAYIKQLTGSIDDIIEAYKKLETISDLMKATGINADNLSRAMINAAGGLDKLSEALQSYHDNFFTDSEKLTAQISSMRDEFAKFGLTMPKTRDEFRQMVNALGGNPEQQARLLTLASAFNDMVTAADDLNASFTDLFNNITDFQDSISSQIASLTSVTATAELSATNLQKAYHNLFNAVGLIGDKVTGSQSEIDLLSAVKSAIMDRYNSEMARLKEVAQAQADSLRAGLQQQIDAINASVNAQVDAINASVTAQVDAINSTTESQIASINAATEAEVSAINSRLDAEIEARQAAHEQALKGLQNELEAANKLKSAIQQVRDYAKSLNLGSSSPLSPEARLAESQRQYQDLLRRAQGGDAEAISQLSGASQSYLDAARQYFGSGTQYANIFDGVKQAMEQIGAMSSPDPDSIQSHIDDLRKSQSDELAQLREAAQSQIKATQDAAKDQIKSLQDSAKDQIKSLQDAAKDQIKAIQDAAKDQIKVMTDDVNQSIKDLTDIDKNPAMKSLRDDTISQLQGLSYISEKVREEADNKAEAAKKILEDQRDYQKNQTDFMGRVAEAIAPVGKPSNQEKTMSDMLVEQRALVTAQTAANPEIIQNLASVDKRLAAIERNLRIA